jgi:spoIIIJ-associated protein
MSNMNSQPSHLEEPVFSARTVEDAIRAGLLELGLDEHEAEVRVLQKGSRGFFGIGSRTAQVQLLPRTRLEPVVRDLAEGLLQRMGIEAVVTTRQVGLAVEVSIESGETDGLLIGRKGETLEAFQHVLLRMAGQQLSGRIQAVRVDVAGYRRRREEQLRHQVQELAERVERTGRRAMTEPLTPGERRLVHRMLADNTRIRTHSGGYGINQRVIITSGRRPRHER